MAASILVIEDEEALVTLLRYNLEAEGYRVRIATSGEEAMLLVAEESFDLVILDWMLPAVSGIEVCKQLRAEPKTLTVPIIMLTARGEEPDRLRGLATGADDYVVKPFSVAELMARVKAVLRRAVPRRTADVIEIADITLDRAAHRVTRAGREVKLGPIEYKLLLVLMESAGRVLSRSQLLDLVWGRDGDIEERTIDVHVGRLRQTLVHASESDPIRTVRGAGYMFQSRDPTQSKAGRRGERRANVPQR